MKNLCTMNFGEQQPTLQFPSEKRCLLLVNERKEERKTMDFDGKDNGEVVVSYDYDGIFLDVKSPTEEAAVAALQAAKIAEIDHYDTSPTVNSFTLGGKEMWLPKETRVGLVNSITIEKAAGKETTVLWFDGEKYELPVDTALQMLSALELYALECYNVTAAHKALVLTLSDVSALVAYDYTAGYPEKLSFNI